MYKDLLQELNTNRRVDNYFIKRLEANGFTIEYGKYSYWDNQEFICIGKEIIWLVETFDASNNAFGIRFRYRNDVTEDIKIALQNGKKLLEKEENLIDEVLKIK